MHGSARTSGVPFTFAVTTLVGLLWWLNGRECILSTVIYWLADGDHARQDILLPDWFSRWIMLGTTFVFRVGLSGAMAPVGPQVAHAQAMKLRRHVHGELRQPPRAAELKPQNAGPPKCETSCFSSSSVFLAGRATSTFARVRHQLRHCTSQLVL